ncbi:threonine-phosphate decarboxylase CobD [Streptococcus suis]|uniref:threonine-phosphate decarboxylase CobD n=1 Tax=Streptococcus suis TaxID=1307 RepID=UPI002B105011|nr:threonine-phosphate decarboxylase [Streptococcus suis]
MKVEHGGNMHQLASDFGFRPEDCLDFSANINPLGLSEKVKSKIIETLDSLIHYPDVTYSQSKAALAEYHSCPTQQILLSNGAVEIFYELARYVKPKKILLLSPTFMEYEKAFRQQGSEIIYHILEGPHYSWTFEAILPNLEKMSSGDLVSICNPNNPTGTMVPTNILLLVAEFLRQKGAYLVLDEAFMDFVLDKDAYSMVAHLKDYRNVIVVRSLTKFYAIPGLRLGYALSSNTDLIAAIDEMRPPWTINALADALVPVILNDVQYHHATEEWLKSEQEFLYKEMTALPDLKVLPPTVNYIFFEYEGNDSLRELLIQEKIFIRSCHNYHHLDDHHYRVAIRSREENERLIQALQSVLRRCDGHD